VPPVYSLVRRVRSSAGGALYTNRAAAGAYHMHSPAASVGYAAASLAIRRAGSSASGVLYSYST